MPSVLSADGCIVIDDSLPQATSCCPPDLCGADLCGTLCSFISLLPNGPMWDYWKQKCISYFRSPSPDICVIVNDLECPSLVLHAIYVAQKLRDLAHFALWPALRESDPTTAESTLDDWLDRYQWEDCYRQQCRSVMLGELTPFEIEGPCGPIYCEFEFPPELDCALKRAIVIALTRANMSPIKNVCGLNWIIEPLRAEIKPEIDAYCGDLKFVICNVGDTLPGCYAADPTPYNPTPLGRAVCEPEIRPEVPAAFHPGCDAPAGLPETIWPNVIAAECIIRSLMPRTCPNIINRCC